MTLAHIFILKLSTNLLCASDGVSNAEPTQSENIAIKFRLCWIASTLMLCKLRDQLSTKCTLKVFSNSTKF